jgi:hypothetical protein
MQESCHLAIAMIFGQYYNTSERESMVLAQKLHTVNPLQGITVSEGKTCI